MTSLDARIEGLESAMTAAAGRIDESVLAEARVVVDRARGRLGLSARHTVIGIAGATGSGKSSTFNALTGLELSSVGVRRPTTSWATACVWGADGATELLEWLGIPERHQTMRDSMLDVPRDGDEQHDFDGVVLLDLPDHDSTEVSHHLEVDRLVDLADLMVWVLDPQKYADAAIHDRYLEPMRNHADIMIVVLNHIDTVPLERRQAVLDDVRRLLDQDGLQSVPVIAASARDGLGIDELRAEINRRVADKAMTRTRLEADVMKAAESLSRASGAGDATSIPADRVREFENSLSEAAGVPALAGAAGRTARSAARRAVMWPLVAWTVGRGVATDDGARSQGAVGADRSRVDAEIRAFADSVAATIDEPWSGSVRRTAVADLGNVNERLDAALITSDPTAERLPGWVGAVRVLHWLLLLLAVAGGVWAVLALTDAVAEPPGGLALPLGLLVGGLVLGPVLALACRGAADRVGTEQSEAVDERLRQVVHSVASTLVVTPIAEELVARTTVRTGVDTALAPAASAA